MTRPSVITDAVSSVPPGSMLDVARTLTERGLRVLPIPTRTKIPPIKEWEKWRLTLEELPQHFRGGPQNIGVLLGEPSGWLIDIDLDHSLAVELAPQFLPPTPAVFGRASKLKSHWLYRITRPAATKKFSTKTTGMLVEFRSTGQQTVFPPSIHESGEPIEWEVADAEPAVIDPDVLLDAVTALADAVKEQLGIKTSRRPSKKKVVQRSVDPNPSDPASGTPTKTIPEAGRRFEMCLASILRMKLVDHNDGSMRLFSAACRIVEFDLDDAQALALIHELARQQPFPREWEDPEILQRVRDAELRCTRGAAYEVDAEGLVPLGQIDPLTGKPVLSPKRTLPTAEAFEREFFDHPLGRCIHSYAGLLLKWQHNRFTEIEDEALKHIIQRWLHGALRYSLNRQTGVLELIPFESNPGTVKSALDSIRSWVHLPVTTTSPSWLSTSPDYPPAHEILPCRSTLLHLPTGNLLPGSPALFTLNALEFNPDLNAPAPQLWLTFLNQLFGDDAEAICLLQEWFGYCLTGDTSLQKMLLVVGPRRGGKGTIARVLTRLVGVGNVCSPTTSALAGPFGLQPLIGKSLAIVSDARFHGESIPTVVERLLCISGEDALTIDRKFLGAVTMKLATRFMFMSNELPRLQEASGALAGRFVILRLTQSFFGKEDPQLLGRLLVELPGILNWALEGRQRLYARGRFVIPASASEYAQQLEDLSSPVGAFLRETCQIRAGLRVLVDDLFQLWCGWCKGQGLPEPGDKQRFGRNLVAACPNVICRKGTGGVRFYEGVGIGDQQPN